ncbi:sigma 54-interacting transcriptional regulator [[Clostridium] symbiosum]|uniref:sigma-54 interaction domain-containing protein n=1 Tax=Clostridium symbiosum TaxID=1512 RepID=UPI001D0767D8|nr:sigma 54-interacting transcriptional regulator [[Clostridium] symbiosum]MCB6609236.1 sigma 54-interacting transcriptional regulator [[Clostridium] symbiosum]MCB6933039.1 sigma 54-interacting transcriptional regulator [[Clostridium] symbiosum]
MELMEKLFHGKGYIDGITIINLEGEILFTAKLNNKLSSQEENYELVGKKFLDVYENLDPKTSTTIKAMELGLPVYVENQPLKAEGQEEIRITSLSIPIKSGKRIVGAIDLSMQENAVETDNSERIELSSAFFPINGSGKLLSRDTATFTIGDIIAMDEKMQKAREYIKIVAACDLPVMIYGETGTGKEVFAQAIHNTSARKGKPFIAQNCAALPDTLLESILFGTAKGAFTGATENKGLFELADGGTLFLDEINSMPIHLQSKLLRVLQDGHFRSLGARDIKTVDVKIIAAINTEPLKAIEEGNLRRDIYYRLSMMSITIPPLRERKKDIAHFVNFYVNKHNGTFNKKVQYVSKELIARLEEYDWPGNVRELEHIIVYGMSMVGEDSNMLKLEDIEDKFNEMTSTPKKNKEEGNTLCSSLREAVDEYEKSIIVRTMKVTGGNISEAAKILDIPRQTLQRKIQQYGILR